MHTARLNLFVCLHVCLNGLYFYVLGLCVMSLLYICVRCKTLCIIGGQRDGLCPFWQPARSIFTVLLCCVFSRANKLSLSLSFSLNRSCTWEYDNVSALAVLSDDLHNKKWSASATQEARKKLLSGRQHTSM